MKASWGCISTARAITRATIRRATNCDLCEPIGGLTGHEPMCVHACPHDAAHRMTGPELRAAVLAGT